MYHGRRLITLAAALGAVGALTVSTAPVADAAAALPRPVTAQGLPQGCYASLRVASVYPHEWEFDGADVNLWESNAEMPIKGAPRVTWVGEDKAETTSWSLAVYPDGRVYEIEFDMDTEKVTSRLLGRTLKGVTDLEISEAKGRDLAVFLQGKGDDLYRLPLTFDERTGVRLGRLQTLKAKGWTKVRGFEWAGETRRGGRVVQESFLAHTRDGRLVRGTVTYGTKPTLTTTTMATRGWSDVTALGVGACESNAKDRRGVLLTWKTSKRLVAYTDSVRDDAKLSVTKAYDLTSGTRQARPEAWKDLVAGPLY